MLAYEAVGNLVSPWLLAALSVAGAVLSLRMALQGAGARGLPGCGVGSGCEAVTRSRWSKWVGVPVAAPAAVLYGFVAGGCVTELAAPSGDVRHMAQLALLAAAQILAVGAVWFVGLQGLLLRRFCMYCLLLHGIALAVAGAIAFGPPGGGFRFAYAGLPVRELIGALSVAGVGVAALVLGQVMVAPKTYMVGTVVSGQLSVVGHQKSVVRGQLPVVRREGADKPTAQRSRASDASRGVAPVPVSIAAGKLEAPDRDIGGSVALRPRFEGNAAAPAQTPTLPSPGVPGEGNAGSTPNPYLGRRIVVSGRVPLQCGVWPMVGDHDARDVLVFLFRYTCANCRHLHGLLGEAMAREPGRLAVMMAPVPTDPGCNPNIVNCGPDHADACAYARLALWVWKADWPAFAGFNRYLFDGDRPPPLAAAWSRAELLAGRVLPDPRQSEPEADRLIGLGVGLHKSVKSDLTPTLLMPRNYLAGHVPTGEKLEEVLAKEIGGATRSAAV
jgi:uncharacterized membrane protein